MNQQKTILTIDNGNTNPHIGFFHGDTLKDIKTFNQDFLPYEPFHYIYSNVGDKEPPLLNKGKLIDLSHLKKDNFFADMPFNYTQTIGDDRLYQSYYLFKKESEKNIILVDAGTFTTIDFISSEGLQGGYILPGVNLLAQTYRNGTLLRPPQKIDLKLKSDLPHSTEEAISQGLALILTGLFEKITQENHQPLYYLTGGSSATILPFLKKVKIKQDPHLIHKALYFLSSLGKEI